MVPRVRRKHTSFNLPIGAVRHTHSFFKLIGENSKNGDWLLRSAELPVKYENTEVMKDEEFVSVLFQDSMIPFFLAGFHAARALDGLSLAEQVAAAKRIGEDIPKVKTIPPLVDIIQGKADAININLSNLFGAFFEAVVFGRVNQAGVQCKFIPRNARGKTPDIACDADRYLIECKDSLSHAGKFDNELNLIRCIRQLIIDARDQLLAYDPKETYEHIIFVDLPEGCLRRMIEMDDHERESFMRKLFFDEEFITSCGTVHPAKSILDNPGRVVFSDFDFGRLEDRADGSAPREPLWIPPPFRGTSQPRLDQFLEKLFPSDKVDRIPISSVKR